MKIHVELSCSVDLTPRVRQMAGLFDVPLDQRAQLTADHDLPFEDRDWSIGLITGPSGAGKSTLARQAWPGQVTDGFDWPRDQSVLDGFPGDLGIRAVTGLLTSVGLGSPPAWMRPYRTLSTGEAFRATVARALAQDTGLVVVDEFTSVVDRQVAKIASHTVQKAVRKSGRKLVAVTCHYDVEEWLQPDWVYDVAAAEFTWRQVQPHPRIEFEIRECSRGVWPVFAKFHYLSTKLHAHARCQCIYVEGRPVAFNSYMPFPHPRTKNLQFAHRIVVLPDWQGLGIAGRVTDWTGQWLYEQGYRYRVITAHPAMIAGLTRSPRWRETRTPASQLHTAATDRGLRKRQLQIRTLVTRSFEYVPPAR